MLVGKEGAERGGPCRLHPRTELGMSRACSALSDMVSA